MNEQDKLEFSRIEEFTIDCGDEALGFLDRLSRDNGWTSDYSSRCMDEYKKFLFLASKSNTPVTPSDQVDQVWHLHLIYTRSYWDELCGKTLQKTIHHGPTQGGPAEKEKYWEQYQQTLDLYLDVFGEEAPSDIWPDVAERFQSAERFLRINRNDFLVARKPKSTLVAGLAIPLVVAACVKSGPSDNGLIIAGIIVSILVIYIICRAVSNEDKRHAKHGAGMATGTIAGSSGAEGDGGCSGCGGCGGCGG